MDRRATPPVRRSRARGRAAWATRVRRRRESFRAPGVAGCVTVGTSTPTYDLIIPLDGSAVHLDTSTYPLTAGFGYVWGASSVDLLGGSCDFSPYEPTHPARRAAAAASARLRLRITRGTDAVSLRIHGTHGPPKVVVHGPHGRDHHLAVERPREAAQGPLSARREQDGWDDRRDAGPSGRGNLDRQPGSGLRVLANDDRPGEPRRCPRRSERACSGRAGCAPCGWPTRCRWERRCDSSSARRASTTRSPRASAVVGARACPRCAPAPTRRSSARAIRFRPSSRARRSRARYRRS